MGGLVSLQEAEEEDGNLIVNRAINYYARYMEAPPLTAICLQSGGKLTPLLLQLQLHKYVRHKNF